MEYIEYGPNVSIYVHETNFNILFFPKITDSNTDFDIFFECIKELNLDSAIDECNKLEDKYPDIVFINLANIHFIKKNYDLSEKYCLMAIELNNVNAMTKLGTYHRCITKNYELMTKYYLMAIDLKCVTTMNIYGTFLIKKGKMIGYKYLVMARENCSEKDKSPLSIKKWSTDYVYFIDGM